MVPYGNDKNMSASSSRQIVLKARYVFPVTSAPIADGFVVVEGDRIVSIGGCGAGVSPACQQAGGTPAPQTVHDLGNAAILPGLVNAHAHLEFSDLAAPLGRRGIGLVDWIRLVIEHRERTTMTVEEAIARGLEESVRRGVTTLGDIVQPDHTPADSPLEVTRFLELKALSAGEVAGAMERAKSHVHRLFPRSAWEHTARTLRVRAAGRCSTSMECDTDAERPDNAFPCGAWEREGVSFADFNGAGLSPHAPFTVHPDLLTSVVELSSAVGAPVAMHLAESPEEMEFLRSGGGPLRRFLEERGCSASEGTPTARFPRPLDYLRRLAEAHRALVIHGNYLNDEEIAFLGANAARMSVVYCPRSHDWFAHDEYPLRKMLAAGATVALGTDGRCSTPDLSLLGEMRFAARRHPGVPPERILRMGTLAGARALGREAEIGSLSPGKLADMTIVALPDRDAADPHELLFDSTEPVVGCYCRGIIAV